jgi:bifunctional DNase/RNase
MGMGLYYIRTSCHHYNDSKSDINKGGDMERLSKAKWCLFGCLIIIFLFAASSVFVPDRLTHAIKWVANSNSACELRALTKQEAIQEDMLIEMVVESVGISQIIYEPVVILKQKEGEIYLPIFIGLTEANAIGVTLERFDMPRPLTPDLLCSVIDRMGADINHIVINDLQDETFYADIILHVDWQQLKIDARPSDAIAVALRVGAPIYATETVLNKAGILSEYETDGYTVRYFQKPASG